MNPPFHFQATKNRTKKVKKLNLGSALNLDRFLLNRLKNKLFSSASQTAHFLQCLPNRWRCKDFSLLHMTWPGIKLTSVYLHLFWGTLIQPQHWETNSGWGKSKLKQTQNLDLLFLMQIRLCWTFKPLLLNSFLSFLILNWVELKLARLILKRTNEPKTHKSQLLELL